MNSEEFLESIAKLANVDLSFTEYQAKVKCTNNAGIDGSKVYRVRNEKKWMTFDEGMIVFYEFLQCGPEYISIEEIANKYCMPVSWFKPIAIKKNGKWEEV